MLLFYANQNPRWLPWTLVGCDHLDFFSRTTACQVTRSDRNVPLEVLLLFGSCLAILNSRPEYFCHISHKKMHLTLT